MLVIQIVLCIAALISCLVLYFCVDATTPSLLNQYSFWTLFGFTIASIAHVIVAYVLEKVHCNKNTIS